MIFDWFEKVKKYLLGAKVKFLCKQPQPLLKSMFAIERNNKRKRKRLNSYFNRLADLLDEFRAFRNIKDANDTS